jgi:hypothetical protein
MTIRGLVAVPMIIACFALLACGGDGGDDGGATISGTVAVEGAPESGATVALDRTEEGEDATVSPPDPADVEPDAEAETDASGDYSFESLDAGNYIVFTDVAGCRVLSLAEVGADETTTVDLEIPANYTPTGPLSLLPSGDILAC